jgi:hypothetical protein
MMSRKDDKSSKINTQTVPFSQNVEEKERGKGLKVVWDV